MKIISVVLLIAILSVACAAQFTVGDNGAVVVGSPGSGGVISINTNAGAFTFTGAVSCTGTTCNFTGGSGSGTVGSGTTGQFAYYSGNGTSVAGRTLQASDIPALAYDASGAAAARALPGSCTLPNVVTATTTSGVTCSQPSNVSGNAATATALASTPSQCAGGQFATGVAASGNANCGTPSGSGPTKASNSGLYGRWRHTSEICSKCYLLVKEVADSDTSLVYIYQRP
jgi:hypothetical protein